MVQQKYKKSYENSSKKFKYFLWYEKETGQVYAYTDDPDIAEIFQKIRKKSLFIYLQKKITTSEIRELVEEAPDTLIRMYDFEIDGTHTLPLPITGREQLTIEHTCIQAMTVSIYDAVMINPSIFTEEMQKSLEILGYTALYREYRENHILEQPVKIRPDYFACFMRIYGDTIELR